MANKEQTLNKTSFEDKPQFQQWESFNDVLLYEGKSSFIHTVSHGTINMDCEFI